MASQGISRRHRVSYNQLESLFEFLNSHKEIAIGYNKSAQAREYSRRSWTTVAEGLNSMGEGALKDWKAWSQYWVDFKAKLKKKAACIRAAQNRTGGGPSEATPLNDIEKKFLSLLGNDYGSGLPNTQVDPFPDLTQLVQYDVPAPALVPALELSPVQVLQSPEPAHNSDSEPAPAAPEPTPAAPEPTPAAPERLSRRRSRRHPLTQEMARESLVNMSRNRLSLEQTKVEHLGSIAQSLKSIVETNQQILDNLNVLASAMTR